MADLYACLYCPPRSSGAAAHPLAEIAQEFSPRFACFGDNLVVVDVAGLTRLLGPAPVIGEELRRAVAARVPG
jgi:hypothetical protein